MKIKDLQLGDYIVHPGFRDEGLIICKITKIQKVIITTEAISQYPNGRPQPWVWRMGDGWLKDEKYRRATEMEKILYGHEK